MHVRHGPSKFTDRRSRFYHHLAVTHPEPAFDLSRHADCFSESSKVGEIGVVETKFGTHLIKLNEQTLKFDPRNGEKSDGGWSM